jgi:signal transduction histidine kinase
MSRAARFFLAAVTAGVGLFLSSALGLDLGGPRPPLLAVVVVAFFGGAGPAALAWVASVVGSAALAGVTGMGRAALLELTVESAFLATLVASGRRLWRSERAARRHADRAADRLRRLQGVTAALSAARTPADAAAVVLGEGAAMLGASAAAVAWRAPDDERTLEFIAWRGYVDEAMRRIRRFPLTADLPVARAVRERRPVLLLTAEEMAPYAFVARERGAPGAIGALAALPLVLEDRALGAISFGFPAARTFTEGDLALLEALGHQCAQALERASLFEAERAQRAAAEAAARQRDEVLGFVAHDLRSPINAIQLHAEALAARGEGGTSAQAVATAAARMERLVEDLLDVAALDAGRLGLEVEPCPAEALARDAVDALRARAERTGVRLAVEARGDAGCVAADPGRAVQVLENLLVNALQVSGAGATVTLRVERAGAAVRFAVDDEGPGLAPEDLPHVFDRSRRVRGARHKGSGLGLAIAKGLVELHGGRITARARPDRGASFEVELPAATEEVHAVRIADAS